MEHTKANSAAFPSCPFGGGLTKREYIAAMAMQGLLASDLEGEYDVRVLVRYAARAADALIDELRGEK